jgi:hypothetical protein
MSNFPGCENVTRDEGPQNLTDDDLLDVRDALLIAIDKASLEPSPDQAQAYQALFRKIGLIISADAKGGL